MALPAMRSVTIPRVSGGLFEKNKKLPPSNVRDLTIIEQDIPPQALRTLLDGGAPLQHCRLQTGHLALQFRPMETVEILRSTCGQTLETLHLRLKSHKSFRVDPEGGKGLTLHDFTSLKELSINFDLLDIDRSGRTLIELLPQSLESLELIVLQYRERLPGDILHLVRAENQPKLSKMVIRTGLDYEDAQEIDTACRIRGIDWSWGPKNRNGLDPSLQFSEGPRPLGDFAPDHWLTP